MGNEKTGWRFVVEGWGLDDGYWIMIFCGSGSEVYRGYTEGIQRVDNTDYWMLLSGWL